MGEVLGEFRCKMDGRFSSVRTAETNLGEPPLAPHTRCIALRSFPWLIKAELGIWVGGTAVQCN